MPEWVGLVVGWAGPIAEGVELAYILVASPVALEWEWVACRVNLVALEWERVACRVDLVAWGMDLEPTALFRIPV